ncbi:PEP/pyruvate-binding domain-containing protein [Parabacteroides distasonis]|uniref:PEP/pyruvate-binding domain-containing protein n=3 Tax=Parabacteroides distasonis TaxID=823 RepID=UPI00189DF8E4|nr:PEP/pyruvate-binding domain-containing protein [Parabacteroides distasonis]MDB9152953.1 PEP/pyruvate-binding domain-containing protein [Parabacteroides distasonis]MDB9157530.1 PEP/pyruvate-binding domain-containing protein [Parabacteroides distasonis]MDB9163933.1 PEP/pyruvate-binding domain-containing protein [Parabacteroides distasonis]MDB9167825.1 PEP/pyruvate-binding domain-containing protein [Parabacteroides distasonis]
MSGIPNLKDLVFRDTPFANLMNKRIYNVLLIATKYDSFMLEDDGRVDEQIFNEYTSLSLRYPPRFTQVTTEEEALSELKNRNFELIICMPNMDNRDIFAAASEIKVHYPNIPIVVLTPFSKEVSKRIANEDLSAIDYVFSWLGNSELLLAIIKLIEDKMNAPDDTASVGVQIILLVEDSIRFYSSALPHLYKFVLEQSQVFAKEALNDHQRTLRMRGRPKIKLARNYEEAVRIFDQYRDNMLGIISDMSFMHNGVKDPYAGYKFGQYVRKTGLIIPFVLESSEASNHVYAKELNASFIDKNSKSYPQDLKKKIMQRFGFGDFVILNPHTKEEIMRIKDLKDLQKKVFQIPDDSLVYHLSRNHFSRFFYSRAMFPPAEVLKHVDVSDYKDMDEARKLIFDLIVQYRRMKNTGVVAVYQKDRFDEYSNFARIGDGSLGGKGRGLAFIGAMVKRYPKLESDNFAVNIPKTVVICTDIFDEFMETNELYPVALGDADDETILRYFLRASLPSRLIEDLMAFFDVVKSPIAVRSSSLLEDSHYQPFAGIYSTYMVPKIEEKYDMLRTVSDAIKAVYASVFYKDSKAYMTATSNLIDQEKMAIVLQEVVGSRYNDHFYPTMSGVARSLNFYPIGNEKAEDGIANIALGLGKYIVDGGQTLRFSPRHPHSILQMSTMDFALRETQTRFYALDLKNMAEAFSVDDAFNLVKLGLKDADAEGSLKYIVSTYDPYDQIIRDGYYPGGRKILSFVNILQHDVFPLADTLDQILRIGQQEMGRPVEIEFAVNMDPSDHTRATFYLLQIRPIVDNKEIMDEDLSLVKNEETILSSTSVLGHGIVGDVQDIIYVKTGAFNSSNNQLIAYEIEKMNRSFTDQEKGYVLVGPGRWGSSDSWLGIPVKWPHISNARVIVECGLENYRVDPSQGTHFFQNLTSFGVGYFTVNPFKGDGWFDEAFLNAQPAVEETEYLRHVRFDTPITIKMDGKKSLGVVLKP